MKKKLALTAALGLTTAAVSTSVEAAPKWAKKGDEIVKCRGVAKKEMNDCGVKGEHDCAGYAKKDRMEKEWIYVPKGVCKKLAGGVVYKTKTVK